MLKDSVLAIGEYISPEDDAALPSNTHQKTQHRRSDETMMITEYRVQSIIMQYVCTVQAIGGYVV